MKRIGINAVYLAPHRNGGTETYVRDLFASLQQLDGDEQFVLFLGKDHGLSINHPRFELIECEVDPRKQYHRVLWEQIHLPGILEKHHLDLVHFPYSASAIRYRGRSVIGLQDAVRFVAPRSVPMSYRWYRTAIERSIARRKQHVISVSNSDADLLCRHLGLPREQISVVYHSVPRQFVLPNGENIKKHDYLLWAGRPYPHKNVDVLIRAFGLLKKRRRDLPRLRLIGVEHSYHARLNALAQSEGVENLVSVELPVPHDEVPSIFRHALLMLFPSLYEGFGLPALEAMASGTAAICSDIPVFKELYGSATTLCNAHSPQAFADAIDGLLTNSARRDDLALRGRELSKRFAPLTCAQATVDVYRAVINK